MLVIVNVDAQREKEPPNATQLNTNSEQHNDVIATIHILFFVINDTLITFYLNTLFSNTHFYNQVPYLLNRFYRLPP